MKKLLWLDDIRNPMEGDWLTYSPINHDEVIWVKSYNEFVNWIDAYGTKHIQTKKTLIHK